MKKLMTILLSLAIVLSVAFSVIAATPPGQSDDFDKGVTTIVSTEDVVTEDEEVDVATTEDATTETKSETIVTTDVTEEQVRVDHPVFDWYRYDTIIRTTITTTTKTWDETTTVTTTTTTVTPVTTIDTYTTTLEHHGAPGSNGVVIREDRELTNTVETRGEPVVSVTTSTDVTKGEESVDVQTDTSIQTIEGEGWINWENPAKAGVTGNPAKSSNVGKPGNLGRK
jgi:hypothetical protein